MTFVMSVDAREVIAEGDRLRAASVSAGFRMYGVVNRYGRLAHAAVKRHASLPRTAGRAGDITRARRSHQARGFGFAQDFGGMLATSNVWSGVRLITGGYNRSISIAPFIDGTTVGVAIGTNDERGRRLELGFVGVDSLGRHYCVDEETEILTSEGWKRFESLNVDDRVLTLNPVSWLAEWQPVQAVNVFEGPHHALRLEARTVSCLTTPNHRWLIERFYGRSGQWLREWRTTETMAANTRVPLVQKCADLPMVKTFDDDVVELSAWFWTEGSYARRRSGARPTSLRLSQSVRVNPANVERIERLLARLLGSPAPFADGGHWHATTRPNGVRVFTVDRVGCWLLERLVRVPDKVLQPKFLTALTQDQLDLLIDVSILADGHIDAAGVTRLSQANEDRIRAWEMACILAGRPVVTRQTRDGWVTTLLRSSNSHAFNSALRRDRDHARIEPVVHDGVMWCPTTPTGTWLARRDGTVYFTGNSQPPYRHFGLGLAEVEEPFQRAVADEAVRGLP